MDLRHLRYFLAVGEELSFTRAATRLHIAQPPLSQAIRQPEEELGVVLLERGARPLRLTDSGRLFLDRARSILATIEVAVADTRRVGRGQTGKLAIGYAGSAMNAFLPDVVAAYCEACPDVELILEEMLAGEIAEALRQRQIDVGFARPAFNPENGFSQMHLLEEPYLAALPARHILAGRRELELVELADEPFILYPVEPSPSVTTIIIEACNAAGFEPRVVQEAHHLQTVVSLVAAGVGISFVPVSAAQGHERRGVAYVPISPPTPVASLSVAWREGDASIALHRFLSVTADHSRLHCLDVVS